VEVVMGSKELFWLLFSDFQIQAVLPDLIGRTAHGNGYWSDCTVWVCLSETIVAWVLGLCGFVAPLFVLADFRQQSQCDADNKGMQKRRENGIF
jgi:hypothetical protein